MSLESELLAALERAGRKGADVAGLARSRSLSADERSVAEALRELERRGDAVEWNRRWYLIRFTDWRAGRIEMQRGGRALVRVGDRGEAGYSISRGDLGGARQGDLVLIKVRKRKRSKGRRRYELPQASVSKILERRFTEVVGRLVPWHGRFRLEPFDPRSRLDVELRGELPDGAAAGDFVRAELLEATGGRGNRGGATMGRVVEWLGDADDPGVDTEIVLSHFGIPSEFPAEVLERAAAFPEDPEPADFEGRLDLRDRVLVTIDGATARDFDDAISVERGKDGGFRLGVHIADVSHYVPPGGDLDREAYRRGTSVYFPDRAVPMLPEGLSNGLCSLRPDVPRLAVSALLEIDASGEVRRRSFATSVIRSARRMTYSEVHRLLESPRDSDAEEYGEILPMLRRAEQLRRLLYDRRVGDGSLDLDLPEVVLELDDGGRLTGVVPAERTVAHRLIEELMIAANRAVAAELDGHEWPALHRLHASPELETLEDLRAALAAIGLTLPTSREGLAPRAFQRVLRTAHGGPHEALVSSLVLRAMQRAVYSPVEGGHFALSLRHYTHFTSPIRRYPDLLVHRELKRLLAGQGPTPDLAGRLPSIATECSRTERRAESAERELRKWKKVRFLAERVGESFAGTITGVQPFGLFVQLDDFLVDGLVPIRSLTDDYYHFEPDRLRLLGDKTGRIFRLGDAIEVVLTRVDEMSRSLDFEVPGMPPPRREASERRRRSVY